jgi:hypothetical protein
MYSIMLIVIASDVSNVEDDTQSLFVPITS